MAGVGVIAAATLESRYAALALRPARAWGEPPVSARLHSIPEDFVVEEDLGFEPSGAGPHWMLRVRKREANTEWVARELARLAQVRPSDVGFAGLKDRHAVTTQWFSVPARHAETASRWELVRGEGYEVLEARRHQRKLPRGALRGNRFAIRLRGLSGGLHDIEARLQQVAAHGVPNYFGPQRFGNALRNLQPAFEPRGALRARRDPYALSAARSLLFNAVLAQRVQHGTWNQLLDGELVNLDSRNSIFCVAGVDATLRERCARLEVHPTGPLAGAGGARPEGGVAELEAGCLGTYPELLAFVEAAAAQAARRPLRVRVLDLQASSCGAGGADLGLRFALRAGAYATTVLREIAAIEFSGDPA